VLLSLGSSLMAKHSSLCAVRSSVIGLVPALSVEGVDDFVGDQAESLPCCCFVNACSQQTFVPHGKPGHIDLPPTSRHLQSHVSLLSIIIRYPQARPSFETSTNGDFLIFVRCLAVAHLVSIISDRLFLLKILLSLETLPGRRPHRELM
jgi:hypothetical protein